MNFCSQSWELFWGSFVGFCGRSRLKGQKKWLTWRNVFLLLSGYFWLSDFTEKSLLCYVSSCYHQRAYVMACTALNKECYTVGELWDGGEVNILCCGCEKCIGRCCICYFGVAWFYTACVGVQTFVSEQFQKESFIWRREKRYST